MDKEFCMYCIFYEETKDDSCGREPEGICNYHTAIDLVYGHEFCEHYKRAKEE